MKTILIIHSKGGTGKTTLTAALADVLQDVTLVDLDPQQSLKVASRATGKFTVATTIAGSNLSKKYRVIDTPPYRAKVLDDLAENADIIIVPCSEGALDLIAATRTIQMLTDKMLSDKVWLVFTRIRLPLNQTNKQIMQAFKQSFPHVHIAKTLVPQRVAYQQIFENPLRGKALEDIQGLLTEVGLI